jgi:hypothetical protein
MKAHRGCSCIALLVLYLGITWNSGPGWFAPWKYPRYHLRLRWAPKPIWNLCRREKSLAPSGTQTRDLPARSAVCIRTALSQIAYLWSVELWSALVIGKCSQNNGVVASSSIQSALWLSVQAKLSQVSAILANSCSQHCSDK